MVVLSLVTSALCTRASALSEHDWQGRLAALLGRYGLLERASALGDCLNSINNETAAVICYASGAKCKDPRLFRSDSHCDERREHRSRMPHRRHGRGLALVAEQHLGLPVRAISLMSCSFL